MTTTKHALEKIRHYISENFLYTRPDYVIGEHEALLEGGIVDSLGVMEIVQFLADEFGVVVEDEEVTEENLGTLSRLAHFVVRRLDGLRSDSADAIEPAA